MITPAHGATLDDRASRLFKFRSAGQSAAMTVGPSEAGPGGRDFGRTSNPPAAPAASHRSDSSAPGRFDQGPSSGVRPGPSEPGSPQAPAAAATGNVEAARMRAPPSRRPGARPPCLRRSAPSPPGLGGHPAPARRRVGVRPMIRAPGSSRRIRPVPGRVIVPTQASESLTQGVGPLLPVMTVIMGNNGFHY